MRCFDEGLLRAYLDGEVSGDERQTFLAHLAETWLPEAQRFRRGDANRYRAATFPPRALTDQSV